MKEEIKVLQKQANRLSTEIQMVKEINQLKQDNQELKMGINARDMILEDLKDKDIGIVIKEKSIEELIKEYAIPTEKDSAVLSEEEFSTNLNLNYKSKKPKLMKPYVGHNSEGDLCLTIEDN